ncbi:zinc ribbon domain-containing protein [Microbacterium sp. RU33B]|uniref:zinc ribbon domain-containing protein n=1 Tax=Microbacterium sp. RU33B TaxID=1907390 RepID=UPI0009668F7F|nr:zinc ribbon domain-containing protein [Microbacterium sp. RU33B]SIT86751.1 3-hydroxy-3-methylglutaryl CoA synthase [Microbacterium sp. RU33B]
MTQTHGIGAYAAYLPAHFLGDNSLDGASDRVPVRVRSVAAFDEDVVTMAVEALRRFPLDADGHLVLATTSAPYEVKTAAGIVHEALGLPAAVGATDLHGSRAGASALAFVVDHGMVVVAADVRTSRSGAPDELAQGDAAAAFSPGADAAVLLARAGRSVELLDRWRLPGERHDRVWDERFTADALVAAAQEVVGETLRTAGRESVDRVVVSSPNPRAAVALRRALGGGGEDAALERQTGFTGAAHPGLLLAAALDDAAPGDTILLVSAAEGADAFLFEVGAGVRAARLGPAVSAQLAERRALSYGRYLRWRGLIDVQGPARPASAAPASPPMLRRSGWKHRLEGSRCESCGAVTTPPARGCAACGHLATADGMVVEPLRDRVARVVSVTRDHLTTMPESEVTVVVADVDGGGRLIAYAADVDPDEVEVGSPMVSTFRRLWTTDGIHNYFWKLRPSSEDR